MTGGAARVAKGFAMTDVVEIAKERQAALVAELAEVGDFIRMAETLVENGEIDAADEHDSSPINLFADTSG